MRVPKRMLVGLILLLVACLHSPGRSVAVGRIAVLVEDAETGMALQGVPVSLAIKGVRLRGKFLWIIPSIEPFEGTKVLVRAKAFTDAEGRADFPSQALTLPGSEELYSMYLFVNAEVDMTQPEVRGKLEFLRGFCAREPRYCGGNPTDIDVAIDMAMADDADRSRAFRNPVGSHYGEVQVRDVEGAKGQDWTGARVPFRIRWLEPRPEFGGEYRVRLSLKAQPKTKSPDRESPDR